MFHKHTKTLFNMIKSEVKSTSLFAMHILFCVNRVGQKSRKSTAFMQLFRLLSYYNTFLNSSDNSCCGARHLPASTALLGICRPRPHSIGMLAPPASIGIYDSLRGAPRSGRLTPPPAALPSRPCRFHISISFIHIVGRGLAPAVMGAFVSRRE